MRVTRTSNGFKVHAVAGTYVVMLGFDFPQEDCDGLLGFSIHRTDHTENESYFLEGMKAFEETDPGFPAGATYSTEHHPVQSFQWADYSAKPGHSYTYRVMARKGTPASLVTVAKTVVRIETESPETGNHDIYFNRGVAASQEYIRRFGDRLPDQVENRQAFIWLSRGLNEALENFVRSADPAHDALRIAAYEFNYVDFLAVVKDAVDRGVDVEIVYDGRKDYPGQANRDAIRNAGLDEISFERTRPKSIISHNKFIVKLTNGAPVTVWTGGTNFSDGGIYGHSNVAHVIEEAPIAAQFLEYWEALKLDPEKDELAAAVEALSPLPSAKPSRGTTVIFSPRNDLDALNWYADLAMGATQGIMITFAFGMPAVFQDVFRSSQAPFRLALMEKKTRPMKQGPERAAEERKIQRLRNMPENVFAIGNFVRTSRIDGWVKEQLSDLNSNVRYVHNKFMLIDPLGSDPIVVAGSANFSIASTTKNDENMVAVRGNRRVVDIYLGEFMRLWSHHSFRESLQWRNPANPPKPLSTGRWWHDSFGDTERSTRRKFFAISG